MNETEATEKLPCADTDRINDFAEEFPPDYPTIPVVLPAVPLNHTSSSQHTSKFDENDDDKKTRQVKLEHAPPGHLHPRQESESVSVGSSSRKMQSPSNIKRTTKTLEHAAPGPQLLPRRPFEFSQNETVPALVDVETQHDAPSALSHNEDSSHSVPADTTGAPATLYLNNRDSEVTNYSNYNHYVTTPGAYAVSVSGYFSEITTSTRSAPDLLLDTSLSETSTRVSSTRAGTVNEESQLQEDEQDELTSAAGAYSVSVAPNCTVVSTTSATVDTGYFTVEAHRVKEDMVVFEAHPVKSNDTVKWYKRPLYRVLGIGSVVLVVILVAVIVTLVRPTSTNRDSIMSPSSALPDVATNSPTTAAPTPFTPQQIACQFIGLESLTECAAALEIRRSQGRGGGTIPTEIGLLTQLTYLSLEGNGLGGSIPSAVGYLSSLTYLSLRENALTGSIPSSIGTLVELNH
ncbi:hypothetical protein MHU86_1373 [Fragilaria crotonensis]|nr:hypothetical protein MHU86_1373 [Fragilaria crotonensis]